MKLLILTQKVDRADANLGFFHKWLEEFSTHAEQVTVITLEKGEYTLPSNVKVLSLGKEEHKSRLMYVLRFYKYIWQERKTYDAVFIHMNAEYAVLGGLVWNILGKKVGLWYTHKSVSWRLKIAEKFVTHIFSASQESFRLVTPKLIVTGHGIDTNFFSPKDISKPRIFTILSAGRISRVKNITLLIESIAQLRTKKPDVLLRIAGEAVTRDDIQYEHEIKLKLRTYKLKEHVHFIGPLANSQMDDFYRSGHVFVNVSDTGSFDKAVLEAMACGVHVLTSNEAFKSVLNPDFFVDKEPGKIAEKLMALSTKPVDRALREFVVNKNNLSILIKRIIELYNGKTS